MPIIEIMSKTRATMGGISCSSQPSSLEHMFYVYRCFVVHGCAVVYRYEYWCANMVVPCIIVVYLQLYSLKSLYFSRIYKQMVLEQGLAFQTSGYIAVQYTGATESFSGEIFVLTFMLRRHTKLSLSIILSMYIICTQLCNWRNMSRAC